MAKEIDPTVLKAVKELLPRLGKRPRVVLEHILKNGSVSTYELGQIGYDQPPRAAQDLKEAGVLLKTSFGKHPTSGSRMAIYSLLGIARAGTSVGRIAFPKKFRQEILEQFGSRCNICNMQYPQTVLQIDHRVPYIIGGSREELRTEDFQALCGSHQRAKSWECEHCPNRSGGRASVCWSCYWARPEVSYEHVATRHERRIDLTWAGPEEIAAYERIRIEAAQTGKSMTGLLKSIIQRALKGIP